MTVMFNIRDPMAISLYYRKHKIPGIEHPQTQYQHVMININITENIKCRGSNIPGLNTITSW